MALSASLAVWFDAAALSLVDPLGRVSNTAPPPFWISRPHKEAAHIVARRILVLPFIILLSEDHFSSQSAALDFFFLLQL